MSIFFIFLLGLFLGSFLNVLADRLPNDKSILGRSHCEYCNHALGAKDLIPLLSFVYLKGKCRYCGKKLSLNYPLSEIFTGVVFAVTYILIFNFQFSIFNEILSLNSLIINLVFSLVIVSVLIAIFLADLRYGVIPDKILAVGTVATVIYLLISNSQFLISNEILNLNSLILNHIVSAVAAFLFFLVIYLLTKGKGIGFGDVKFGFFMGLLLGFPDVLLALYLAFLTGGVVAIILVLWKKKGMKSKIAFGPFLVIGTYVSFFLASLIIPAVADFLL